MCSNRLVSLLVLILLLSACSHPTSATPPRIAVLRFENLTSDVSLDWMGRAASEIVARELTAGKVNTIAPSSLHGNPLAQQRPLPAPGESAERSAAIAEGATRLVIGQISRVGNQLQLNITERDPLTNRNVEHFVASAPPNNLYAAADAVARRLSPKAAPFETRNNDAIAAWSRGLEETDYAKAADDYSHAVLADPAFSTAWLDWATTANQHGDRPGAAHVLDLAAQHAGQFNATAKARLNLARAELAGDRKATLAALNELGRLAPDDPATLIAVAQLDYNARDFRATVAAYRRLTQVEPNNGGAWNQLGYALMFTGDYEAAMAALHSYERLSPKDANPLDSQGDVAFAFGRFAEAEKSYDQATAKDPAFNSSGPLYKAAFARLMTGDITGADKKLDSWVAARRAAKDPTVDFRRAEWLFVSGRRPQALALLGTIVNGAPPQLKGIALTQSAIWDLQMGARDRALQAIQLGVKTGSVTAPMLIAMFSAEDGKAPQFDNPQLAPLKPAALAYAHFFAHQWDAAAPLFKQMADTANPDDNITPIIYGQILVELKRVGEAEPYVRLFPIPNPQAIREFLSVAVPRIFETRAAVLANQGKNAEAAASEKVFKTLSGNSP